MRISARRIELFLVFVLAFTVYALSQRWEDDYSLIDRWTFKQEIISGRIMSGLVNGRGELILMLHKDGIKIVSKDSVSDLARFGQGPGDIQAWSAMSSAGDSILDFESTGRIVFYKPGKAGYEYEKTRWLKKFLGFPFIRAAAFLGGRYHLAGFSPNSRQGKANTEGNFLSVFDAQGQPLNQSVQKDFHGLWRGPFFLNAYMAKHEGDLWMMLESEPILYCLDSDVKIKKQSRLVMPAGYKPIKDYLPFNKYSVSDLEKARDEWWASYSRVEQNAAYRKVPYPGSENHPGR